MFKGRIGRLAYFLGWVYLLVPVLVLLVIVLGTSAAQKGAGGGPNPAVSVILIISLILDFAWMIFYLVAGFGLIIRRWHDLNQSGWLSLLQLIPLVSLITALIQLFAPGTVGSNNYGDQAEPSLNFKTVLFGNANQAPASPASMPAQPVATAPSMPAAPPPVQPQQAPVTPPNPPVTPPPADPSNSNQPPNQ